MVTLAKNGMLSGGGGNGNGNGNATNGSNGNKRKRQTLSSMSNMGTSSDPPSSGSDESGAM